MHLCADLRRWTVVLSAVVLVVCTAAPLAAESYDELATESPMELYDLDDAPYAGDPWEGKDEEVDFDETLWCEPNCGCSACASGSGFQTLGGFGAFAPTGQWREDMRFRHSSTDGRTAGPNPPIEGTSWLNRPYYIGLSTGGFFMTQGPRQNVRNDNDLFGALYLGWDWDFYWGLEARVGRATPELINSTQPTLVRSDALTTVDLSLVYYPWGDTAVRPYLRGGVGWTDFDFPNDDGTRSEVSPFTMPLGVGVKWPVRRWLAARVEFLDNLAFGDSAVDTQHNLTLVLGLEYRAGVRPKSYWPWYPSRKIR